MPRATGSYISDDGTYWAEIWRRRQFVTAMATGNLKAKNVSTMLGMAWWVLNPLLLGIVFYFVIGFIFNARASNPKYLSYLLSGLFPFYYTQACITGAVSSILGNAQVLITVRFPRLLLPLSATVEAATGFGASLVGYVAIIGFGEGLYIGRNTLILPILFLVHTLFNLGLIGLMARLALPFRDVENLSTHFIRLWVYLSPIMWTTELLQAAPRTFEIIGRINPLFSILSLYRSALTGSPIELDMVLLAAGWAVGIGGLGIFVFTRFEKHFARYLL
jgi:teichoic acid transport system permease protein